MAYKRFDAELKKLAKVANQRMRELEKRGISSPAYESAQATLEAMGVKKGKATGRRFSETGKATYNQREAMKKALKKFVGAKTSKITGILELQENIWNTADQNNALSAKGITKDQYFDIWKNLPDKKKDRIFGSQVYINIVSAAMKKNGRKKEENRLSVEEIVKAVEASKDYKSALKAVGLSYSDVKKVRVLGEL